MTRLPAAPPRAQRLTGLALSALLALSAPAGPLAAQEPAPGVATPGAATPEALTPNAPARAPSLGRRRSLDAAVRLNAGTLGIGIEAAKLLTGHLAARVGANVFAYSRTQDVDNVTYDGRITFRSASVLVDLYPARRGSFHLTGGAILGGSEVTGTGVPQDGFSLNGTNYAPEAVGTLRGALTFPRTRPYAGLGWGTPANNGRSVRLTTDLGVAFGKPTVSLRASNAAPGGALAADLAAQQASTQRDVDRYLKLYPVMTTGLSVRF